MPITDQSSSASSSGNTIIHHDSSKSPNKKVAALSPNPQGSVPALVRRPSASSVGDRRKSINGTPMSADSVKSPGELTVFVDKLLSDLEAKFDVMSHDILARMNQMSDRIDQIETSIQEVISTDLDHRPSQPLINTSYANSDSEDNLNSGRAGSLGGNNSDQSLLLAEPPLGVLDGPGSP